jgi:two-component system response regulator AtoC
MKTLLIIDDDHHLLDSLRIVFTPKYNVLIARSTEEAIGILAVEPVDVVLLDVILPGQDGVEFLSRLREQYTGLPVVMISGKQSIRPVLRALDLGVCDYIRKPFDIDELRLVVERALRNTGLEKRVKELEQQQPSGFGPDESLSLKEAVEEYERSIIQNALRRSGGVQTRAATELGTTRRILRYRIDKLGIEL